MEPVTDIDLSNLVAPLYLLLIATEAVLVRRGLARGHYDGRDTATSLTLGAGSVLVDVVLGAAVFGLVVFASEYRWMTLSASPLAVFLCFVLTDFVYYWSHRFSHRIRWVWASHVVHHSSQQYNLSTALRQTWTGPLTGLVILWVPLALIGFSPALLASIFSHNLIYQFWIHTEAISRLPRWFEAVFNTPSHHRVHHGANPRYLDANYGGTLIVWDRLLGTFVPEDANEPVRYGLVHNIDTHNPIRAAFHELVDIGRDVVQPGLTRRERLAYVFAPPGWSHDGSRMDSTAVKAAFLAAHPEAAGQPGLPAATEEPDDRLLA